MQYVQHSAQDAGPHSLTSSWMMPPSSTPRGRSASVQGGGGEDWWQVRLCTLSKWYPYRRYSRGGAVRLSVDVVCRDRRCDCSKSHLEMVVQSECGISKVVVVGIAPGLLTHP